MPTPPSPSGSPTPGTARPARSTTRGPGWPIATTPTPSPTSRPRTPTPTRGWREHAPLRRRHLRRDQGPHPGDRRDRAGPQGAVVVRHPHGGGARPTPSTAAARRAATATRDRAPRRERSTPPATASSSSARFDVSPGHGLLAWSADVNGHEEFTLRIRDLATGADLPDLLERHLLRHGVVGRRALPLLHGARPRHAALPGVAPRARHRAGRRRARLRGARRALQPRRRADPQRRLRRHHRTRPTPRPRCWSCRRRPAGRAAARRGRAPSRTTSTASTTGATAS